MKKIENFIREKYQVKFITICQQITQLVWLQ